MKDTTPPVCQLIAVSPGPLINIDVRTQDTGSGLACIDVATASNATVTVPSFTPGTIDSVIVNGEKIDLSRSSRIALNVYDVAGNRAYCDPVLLVVARETRKPLPEIVTGIPDGDTVYVNSDTPGLKNLESVVNGDKYQVAGLKDGEERAIDVSASLIPDEVNTFKVTPFGKPGTTATVTIPVVP